MSIEELTKEFYYYWSNIHMYQLYAYEVKKKLESEHGVLLKAPKYTKHDIKERSKIYYDANREKLIMKSNEHRRMKAEQRKKEKEDNYNNKIKKIIDLNDDDDLRCVFNF